MLVLRSKAFDQEAEPFICARDAAKAKRHTLKRCNDFSALGATPECDTGELVPTLVTNNRVRFQRCHRFGCACPPSTKGWKSTPSIGFYVAFGGPSQTEHLIDLPGVGRTRCRRATRLLGTRTRGRGHASHGRAGEARTGRGLTARGWQSRTTYL